MRGRRGRRGWGSSGSFSAPSRGRRTLPPQLRPRRPSEKPKMRTKVGHLMCTWNSLVSYCLPTDPCLCNDPTKCLSQVKSAQGGFKTLGSGENRRTAIPLVQEGFSCFLVRITSASELGFLPMLTTRREVLSMCRPSPEAYKDAICLIDLGRTS